MKLFFAMEKLLTKQEGVFKYIKITESYLGLTYSGTIIYFRLSKDILISEKENCSLPSLPKANGLFRHFFKKRNNAKQQQIVIPNKDDEIILDALASVYSKLRLETCLQIEGQPNRDIEKMVEGCKIAAIDIQVISKNKDEVTNEFHIPLKMFVKDAESFEYYNNSSYVYTSDAIENITEIKKNLERISHTDFFN